MLSHRLFRIPAAAILAACSAASMILGLARELVSARLFGASRELDLFLFCYMPFDLLLPAMRDVPVALQSRLASSEGPRALRTIVVLAKGVLGAGLIGGLVYFVIYFQLVGMTMGTGSTALWATTLVCVALAIPVALTHIPLSALGMYARRIVLFHGYQQIYLNGATVAALILIGPQVGVMSLAVGLLMGALLLLTHEYLRLRGDVAACRAAPMEPHDRKGLLVMVAFVAAQAIGSKSAMLVERTVGLTLPPGSISQLNYALRLWGIPINLFVIATIVPYATRLAISVARQDFNAAYQLFCRVVIVLSLAFVPFVAMLSICAEQIVALLFQTGRFTAADTLVVAELLRILVWGSFGLLTSTAAVYTLWSLGRSVPVAIVTWGALAAYIALSWVLARIWGIAGLAIGSVVYYNLQAVLLLALLKREFKERRPVAAVPSPWPAHEA